MKLLLYFLSILLLSCSSGNKAKLQLPEHESGYYFIIWTTDASLYPPDMSEPIRFDKNKVVYLNYSLQGKMAICPFNLENEDISKRLKNFMGGEFYMHFYNPTDEEYAQYPGWDEYYLHKHITNEREELESKGYKFEDNAIKEQLRKEGKYR